MHLNPFNRRGQRPESSAAIEREANGARNELAARLQQECAQLTAQFRTPASFGYDPEARTWWVRLAGLPLPQPPTEAPVPVIVLLGDNYPAEGPDGAFLPRSLAWAGSLMSPNAAGSQEEDLVGAGWARCDIPGLSWRETDSLCRLLETLVAVLTAVQRVTVTLGAGPDHYNELVSRPSPMKGEAG